MDKENKIAFCIGDTEDGPVLIFGITPKAWEYMKDGETHQFDLTKVGVPFKVMMFGAADYQSALDVLTIGAQMENIPVHKVTDIDLSFQPKEE